MKRILIMALLMAGCQSVPQPMADSRLDFGVKLAYKCIEGFGLAQRPADIKLVRTRRDYCKTSVACTFKGSQTMYIEEWIDDEELLTNLIAHEAVHILLFRECLQL